MSFQLPMRRGDRALIDFGLAAAEFRSQVLEQTVRLHRGALRERPVAWADLDALLDRVEPVEPWFRLYAGTALPAEAYADEVQESGVRRRRLARDRLLKLMRGGATLVLNRLELFSPAAQALSREVAQFAGHPTTANAYACFGGPGTFGKHWDVHDVFALQLLGRKHWQVYAPSFPYPLGSQTSDRLDSPCPSEPVLDCVLEAGDLLYIPRGWWHQALPLGEPSLHLSVAAFVPTVLDFVLWACSRVLPASPRGRKGLVDAQGSAGAVAAALPALSAALADPRLLEEFQRLAAGHRAPPPQADAAVFSNLAGEAAAPQRRRA